MRICAHGFSSFLAILGGTLFLVLPLAFLNGTISINTVFSSEPPCVPRCPRPMIPMPDETAFYLVLLGVIGILLGLLALRLDKRSRIGVGLGFAFILGLMTFLFWMTIPRLESFSINPFFLLDLPELAVVVMAGATIVFVYEFLRARLSLPLTITEPSAHI